MKRSRLRVRAGILGALVVSRIARAASPSGSVAVLIAAADGRFLLPLGDMYVGRRIGRPDGHDRHVLRTALEQTGPGSEILIIGAHVGTHAIPLAVAGRRVAVVEANPETFDLLITNAHLNGVDFIGALRAAAHETQGYTEFISSTVNTGGSKVRPNRVRFEYTYDSPATIKVPTIALDSWDVARDMKAPLLIVDIEGSELRALRGMPNVLRSCVAAIIEINPTAIDDSASSEQLQELLSHFFDEAINTADDRDIYEPDRCVEQVRKRHGQMVSVDLLFRRRT
jgi:FkbM family methyltransferase